MTFRLVCTVAGFWFLAFAVPEAAWAVQAHGGAEGLVSHQIGHILFTIGMVYLLCRIQLSAMRAPGWFAFKVFLVLLILWNLLTFAGHWLNEFVDRSKFVPTPAGDPAFRIETVLDTAYYLTRLDHLVLVPAFVCLLLALNRWRREE